MTDVFVFGFTLGRLNEKVASYEYLKVGWIFDVDDADS